MELGQPFLRTLDRMGCGALVLDSSGEVLDVNLTGRGLLARELSATDDPESSSDWSRRALKRLLKRADGRFRVDSETWITVPGSDGGQIVLHSVPLRELIETGPHTILILVDLGQRPIPSGSVLQRLFDLTPAEAKVAIEICSGKTLSEVASSAKLSNATLRTQLSSVFSKTQTRRQSELVALLARVAILP